MPVVTIHPAITPYMFLTDLSVMKFRVDAGASSVAFAVLDASGAAVFSNTYIPDDDGTVSVLDIDTLLRPLLRGLVTKFSFKVGSHILSGGAVKVVNTSVRVNCDAVSFLSECWLSAFQGDVRVSAPGRVETLHAYVTAETPERLHVEGRVYDAAACAVSVCSFDDDSLPVGYVEIDASPAVMASRLAVPEGLQLLSYTVTLGRRTVTYRLTGETRGNLSCFMFVNCFGQPERIYFTGAQQLEPQFERSQALVSGEMKTYDVRETAKVRAYTGPLPRDHEALLFDLLRARDVAVVRHEATRRHAMDAEEVVILSCDPKVSLDPSQFSDAELVYRPVSGITALITPRRRERTFDDSFDNTFD